MIGSKLGQLKLEYIFKDSVFISSKMYGGITTKNSCTILCRSVSNMQLKLNHHIYQEILDLK
jgi:hypothetical protein